MCSKYKQESTTWKSGLDQYIFYIDKIPLKEEMMSKTSCIYLIHIDIKDTVGRCLISVDMSQEQFLDMIILMMIWIVDLIDLDPDIPPTYNFSILNGVECFSFKLEFNDSFLYHYDDHGDISNLSRLNDSLWYDEHSEMYRDIYLDVEKNDMITEKQNMLLVRIPVSIFDLYMFINAGLSLISDIDISAGVLEQIDMMYKEIERMLIL